MPHGAFFSLAASISNSTIGEWAVRLLYNASRCLLSPR